ncbi:MAG: Gfo/Idh/MocA family oxidoreductase [Verrucomicrobia bacterium]|nr:Gfo/Idh/MocA family oxidoreductase [Verrucomicrobiota bacterium]
MKKQEQTQRSGAQSRRNFIKKAAGAAAAAVAAPTVFKTPVYGQNQAPSTGRVIGANDRIVVGFVGLGGQGTFHLRNFVRNASKWNVAVGAVCDLWSKRREAAKQIAGGQAKAYEDYRKLLEQKDIDAVVNSTVVHWHAQITIDTAQAGKHTYCEKPLTRYLDETFKVYDIVKRSGIVFQLGAQACSDAKWQKAAELVKAGMLGPLVLGQSSYMRNNPKGEWNYRIDPDFKPDGINWNEWQGPNIRKRVDFSPEIFFRWRKYYPYSAGILDDLFPHRLSPLMLVNAEPEWPIRVCSVGTKKILTDKNTPGAPIRDVRENVTLIAEFPSGYSVMVCGSTVNEYGLDNVVRGHVATVTLGGTTVEYRPERPFTDEYDPERYTGLVPPESVPVHEENWISCIRSGKKPHADIELAARTQAVISLGEMSDRLGIACHFDPKTRTITDGCGRKLEPISYGKIDPS